MKKVLRFFAALLVKLSVGRMQSHATSRGFTVLLDKSTPTFRRLLPYAPTRKQRPERSRRMKANAANRPSGPWRTGCYSQKKKTVHGTYTLKSCDSSVTKLTQRQSR